MIFNVIDVVSRCYCWRSRPWRGGMRWTVYCKPPSAPSTPWPLLMSPVWLLQMSRLRVRPMPCTWVLCYSIPYDMLSCPAMYCHCIEFTLYVIVAVTTKARLSFSWKIFDGWRMTDVDLFPLFWQLIYMCVYLQWDVMVRVPVWVLNHHVIQRSIRTSMLSTLSTKIFLFISTWMCVLHSSLNSTLDNFITPLIILLHNNSGSIIERDTFLRGSWHHSRNAFLHRCVQINPVIDRQKLLYPF